MSEQVSIITTTYRNYDKLQKCISSVMENTKYVEYKHYLYCNSPDDKIKKIVHDAQYIKDQLFNDRIDVIFNDDNSGSFSSNNNEAVKYAEGKYILLLNDDIEILPQNNTWLYNMVNVLETDEKAGVVGALLLYPDKKTIQHCGVFFSQRTNNLPYHMNYRQPLDKVIDFVGKYRYYQAVIGACLLIRREDYLAVGGMDTSFYYCYEDTGLCLDIKTRLKKSCVYCPDAQLIHNEGISSKQNNKLQENIKVFKNKYTGQYMNDLEFYLSNPNHMIYRKKW